jgi:hypothetical protein
MSEIYNSSLGRSHYFRKYLWKKALYRVSHVLPPDRKHPRLKIVKNSGMIVYRSRTFGKNFIFFNETRPNSITATLIYIILKS